MIYLYFEYMDTGNIKIGSYRSSFRVSGSCLSSSFYFVQEMNTTGLWFFFRVSSVVVKNFRERYDRVGDRSV